MKIANAIKTIALAHGKSVSQLAQEFGVLQPQLSRTINNPRITLEDMEKIAEAIGCSVSDFFNFEEDKDKHTFVCPHCGKPIKVNLE